MASYIIVRLLDQAGGKCFVRRLNDMIRGCAWATAVIGLVVLAGCDTGTDDRTSNNVPIGAGAKARAADGVRTPGNKATSTKTAKADVLKEAPKLKVVGQKVTLTWQEAGKPKFTAVAEELTGNSVAATAVMKKVSAKMFDKGQMVATMTAPVVQGDEKTKVVTATGGVTIKSVVPGSSIQTVKSDWVKWYSQQDKLVGGGGVTAVGPMATMKAAAFTADTKLKTIRIFSKSSDAQVIVGKR